MEKPMSVKVNGAILSPALLADIADVQINNGEGARMLLADIDRATCRLFDIAITCEPETKEELYQVMELLRSYKVWIDNLMEG